MRVRVAAAIACLLAGGTGLDARAGPARPTVLEITLRGCSDSQRMVSDALQTSDLSFARRSLKTAQAACRSAAAELRKARLPGVDPVRIPAAIDEMAAGLGQVDEAMGLLNKAPAHARRKARDGLRMYQHGLAALKAAPARSR